jgi:hypothetical protein
MGLHAAKCFLEAEGRFYCWWPSRFVKRQRGHLCPLFFNLRYLARKSGQGLRVCNWNTNSIVAG